MFIKSFICDRYSDFVYLRFRYYLFLSLNTFL
nr:MAG TPA: hypothetical protein [Caudoviricetes sp.]